jgi:hypothetical protein
MKKETKEQRDNFQMFRIAYLKLHEDKAMKAYYALKDADNPSEQDLGLIAQMENEYIPLLVKNIGLTIKVEALKCGWSMDKVETFIQALPNKIAPTKEYLEAERSKVDIGCPICKSRLVYSHQARFETLVEHASPSDYISKKDSFRCINVLCLAHQKKLVWLSDGEGPFGHLDWKSTFNYIDDNKYPFRTWHRKYEAEKEHKITIIENKWFLLRIVYHSRANENGEKNRLFTTFKFRLYVSDGHSGFVLYQSGLHMLIYSLTSFIRCSDKGHDFKELKDRVQTWDKRWWSRLSFTLIKLFYKPSIGK